MTFTFTTDDRSRAFCRGVVSRLIALFGISEEEAVARVNRQWDGMSLLGEQVAIYHEDEDYWAHAIDFGRSSRWWDGRPDRKPTPPP